MEQYSRYFSVGMKVGVSIPLPNASVFKDWAIVQDIDEDLIALQLSRDMLPSHVSLRYGQILELRCGGNNDGYCCRALIVSEGVARQLMLRLIGEIVSDDLREFYRIDAFLPIKYYVSREQDAEQLRTEWNARRTYRLRQKNHSWNGKLLAADAELPQERLEARDDIESSDPNASDQGGPGSWDTIIPLAANISGGGLRLITHQSFESGEYSLLEILVPSPQRVVDVVARIVFANRNYAVGTEREYFNTGMQFVYIDERDRDAIVTYISTIQLMRNRQLLEEYMFRTSGGDVRQEKTAVEWGFDVRKIAIWTVSAIILLLIATMLFNFFWEYAQGHPKGEIEQTFEGGIRKYREQRQ
jgi:hypothetical protein